MRAMSNNGNSGFPCTKRYRGCTTTVSIGRRTHASSLLFLFVLVLEVVSKERLAVCTETAPDDWLATQCAAVRTSVEESRTPVHLDRPCNSTRAR